MLAVVAEVHLTAVQLPGVLVAQAVVGQAAQLVQPAAMLHSTVVVAAVLGIPSQLLQKWAAPVLTEWLLSAMLAQYNLAQVAQ
jgi:hypothetical protein